MGIVVILGVLLPRFGRAHTLGLSTADFVVRPEGPVDAVFDFARGEPLGPAADLGSFLQDGVGVTADGAPCQGAFLGAEPDAVDGVRLTSTYACPRGAARIDVTLYYLSALPSGHRQVARIVAGSATVEAILTSDRRAISLQSPYASAHANACACRRTELVRAGIATIAAAALALVGWVSRRARRR